MVVVTLTDCPPKLRGDLTKWLCEINTGVYVGKISARVRDELWGRICENLSKGKATMVYSANNEQGFKFKVHHTFWTPVDFDGITLMKRLESRGSCGGTGRDTGCSKAAQFQKAHRIQMARQRKEAETGFIVVDLETSGLSPRRDEIIEFGALHVVNGEVADRISLLVKSDKPVPQSIQKLTGITDKLLEQEGRSLSDALEQFLQFIGTKRTVYHNAGFDRAFLHSACDHCGYTFPDSPYTDTMALAKQVLDEVENYSLETLVRYFGRDVKQTHRALEDCELTLFIYNKLNETE